ncbi:hypothetical protein JHK84_055274 [Glycine max]|nr:hypothetical protein JHK86_055244 [Glycine max]KAG4917951.1 hypothetical protein JHK85_056232 [Glycine max]KAG5074043.1 hypothetical protein JHK84_055274 [Glycine max]
MVWVFCAMSLVVVVSFSFVSFSSLKAKLDLKFDFVLLFGLAMRRKVSFGVYFCSVAGFDYEKKRMSLAVVVSFSFVSFSSFRAKLFLCLLLDFKLCCSVGCEKKRLCDYKVMACVADKIKLIDGSREAFKLSVRITDLWFIRIPEKSEQVEMVVVDSDGDEIHVVCKQDQLKSRKANLKENLTYLLLLGNLIWNTYFLGNSDLLIFPVSLLVIFKLDSWLIRSLFAICGLILIEVLMDFQIRCVYLVVALDVIGVVDEVFLSYLNDIEDERLVVILLTYARIKEAQGSYLLSVSNSFKAFKLMINNLVLEIQEFRESLLDLGIEVRSVLTPIGQGSSQVSRSSQLSSKDVFLSKAEEKNISQINATSEEIVCVSVAKITTMVMDNYSWCYLACGQCYKKADIETVSFTCPCGKDNDQPLLRYRVEVMVNHQGEQTKFFIWDRECAQLIGQSTDEVNRLKIEDGDVDLNASPQALDRLLGCFLAFKVKVQPRFRNFVVLKYSDESDLINVVLDMIPDSESCCKIENSILESTDPTELESQSMSVTADHDCSMLNSSEPTELESQSVSVTGDYDPLLRIPLTPTKRVSSDELDDE